ncbi:hypothetical protein BGZ76_008713, partial [Entomortierella beljakovae]
MATKASDIQEKGNEHGVADCQKQHASHSHVHVEEFKNKHSTPLHSLFDEPVKACYEQDSLPILLTLSETDMVSIKEAFINPPIKNKPRDQEQLDRASAAGLDPLPDYGSVIASASKEKEKEKDGNNNNGGGGGDSAVVDNDNDKNQLGQQFQIGFSKQHGHSIELSNDNSNGYIGPRKVNSGTFILQKDEMPYACVIQNVWKGKLCEECLRVLPTNHDEVVECPLCRSEGGEGGTQKAHTSTRFCSKACLQEAWKSWHGYECLYTSDLSKLRQQTRLALRIYWKNIHSSLSLSAPSQESETESDLIIAAMTNINLNSSLNGPRVNIKDGSALKPSQLCHNFKELDSSSKISYLMTGYYLERLLDLPEGSALELAYLQTLVRFNSFAVKSRVSESVEGDDSATMQLNDYTVGSALYLLASMFNHSCAPNAMVVFGRDGRNSSGSNRKVKSNPDPRLINVITTRTLKVDPDLPVQVDIS